jgi:hypothetical protein
MNLNKEFLNSIRETTLQQSRELGESNDCGVISISIASGRPYQEIHKLFVKHGRSKGKGVSLNMIKRVLDDLGYKSDWDVCQAVFGKRVPVTHARGYFREGNYIAITRTHALAVVNGNVVDWMEGRRHQIKFFFKLDRK